MCYYYFSFFKISGLIQEMLVHFIKEVSQTWVYEKHVPVSWVLAAVSVVHLLHDPKLMIDCILPH